MASSNDILLAFDVGEKRIGVAKADAAVKLAYPLGWVEVDDRVFDVLRQQIADESPVAVVVGYPRNQSGEPTTQTAAVESFVQQLALVSPPVVFQDESVTSLIAEERLQKRTKRYQKGDIDAEAAAIILQDYLEQTYGH